VLLSIVLVASLVIVLGGEDSEIAGCPSFLEFEHLHARIMVKSQEVDD
jgi:hypothetical protein